MIFQHFVDFYQKILLLLCNLIFTHININGEGSLLCNLYNRERVLKVYATPAKLLSTNKIVHCLLDSTIIAPFLLSRMLFLSLVLLGEPLSLQAFDCGVYWSNSGHLSELNCGWLGCCWLDTIVHFELTFHSIHSVFTIHICKWRQ